MTNAEILEIHRIAKAFDATELGNLFNKFTRLHARAWQLDSTDYHRSQDKAWKELEPIEKQLRFKLMEIAGVNNENIHK